MTELNECIGINITNDGIAVACIEKNDMDSKLDICEYRTCNSEDELPSIMDKLSQELDLFEKPCVVALEPKHYEVFLVDAVEFDEENKVENLQERVGDLLDFPVEKAVLEYIELPGDDGKAGKMAYIIAAHREAVEQQVALLLEAGVDVIAVDIAETGLRNIAASLKEAEGGTLYLHLHSTGSKLLLVRGGTIGMMRSIDLDVSCLFPGEETDMSNNEIMKEVFIENLSNEIERSISYCTATLGQPTVSQIVIAPMAADLQGLLPSIAEKTNMNIRMMGLSEVVSLDAEMMPEHQQRCLLAVGAAMRDEVA